MIIFVSVTGIFLSILIFNSCTYRHSDVLDDLVKLDNDFDPILCESTLQKIIEFDNDCEPEIEIIDCG